jgi:4-amino-4-deoxy-L-arabinose transferase-like glycosyltransferase
MQSARSQDRQASLPFLAAILCVAVALRCAFLAKQSLWLDEFASWWFASGDLARALYSEPTNPPLYYAILHFWIRFFGTSEVGLRSLNILPSVGSVWLVYRLASRLFSGRIALIAAGYMAISPFQIYYAQEARCFSFLEFFLLSASVCLWIAMGSSGKKSLIAYAGYAALMTLALYSHFIAVFFFAGQGLFVLFWRRKQILFCTGSAAVAVGLFFPWMVTLLEGAGGGGQTYRRHLWLKLPQAFFSFLFGDSLIPLDDIAVSHISETLWASAPILVAAILACLILIPFCWLAWKRWGDGMLYAAILAMVPALLAFVVSFKVVVFDERYLMAASSFLCVALAAGIAEIFERHGWQVWAGEAAAAGFAVLLAISLYHYYFIDRFGKDQWREAISYIETSGGPRDFILFDPDFLHFGYDYYKKTDLPYLSVTGQMAAGIVQSPESFRTQVSGFNRLWVVRMSAEDDIVLRTVRNMFTPETTHIFTRANQIGIYSFLLDGR